jgi:hypothetical protein
MANLMIFNTHDHATGDICSSRRQIAANYLNSDRYHLPFSNITATDEV